VTTPDTPWPDLSGIRLLVLDFDGVLTDNRVIVHQDGSESVVCHRGDGMGVQMLKASGVEVFVLSKQKNPVVAARCNTLGIPFQQNTDDKLPALMDLIQSRGLSPEQVAYVGNDVNDLEALRHVGVPIAVRDAEDPLFHEVRAVTTRNGGFGAVREVCDRIMLAQRADR
jgi:YrbI family 3-deoxy-D-manno-octulosonate 8-phosphate phosphatase